MAKSNKTIKKELGLRFLLFRKAIGKTVSQLSSEMNVSFQEINGIENGVLFPNIKYLHYFYNKHNLNLNWLLTGQGHMFMEHDGLGTDDPRRFKYAELLGLMQVPAVEQAINAALTQIRATLELEVHNGAEGADGADGAEGADGEDGEDGEE